LAQQQAAIGCRTNPAEIKFNVAGLLKNHF